MAELCEWLLETIAEPLFNILEVVSEFGEPLLGMLSGRGSAAQAAGDTEP